MDFFDSVVYKAPDGSMHRLDGYHARRAQGVVNELTSKGKALTAVSFLGGYDDKKEGRVLFPAPKQ